MDIDEEYPEISFDLAAMLKAQNLSTFCREWEAR